MFKQVKANELPYNACAEIGQNWTLISAKNSKGAVNTMTASWGAMGVLWGMDAVTVYIRQSRYTKEFVDDSDFFTLSLFDGYKKELGVLGTKSGRDGDKIAEVDFHVVDLDGQPGFDEAKCVLICRKLYQDDIRLEDMPADVVERFYADGDYHTMYIGEIAACYVRE